MDVRSDTQRQDQERIYMRDDESDAGFQKITERQLNSYGHMMRRDEEHILRKVLRTDVPGKRKRG